MTVKDAVQIATKYLKDLYPDIRGLQLEEIETDDSGEHFLVTMSFVEPETLSVLLSRGYKQLKIRKADGEVLSMKIRTLN